MTRKKLPEPIGGGWFLLPDGKTKLQGRVAAYRAAGLDPKKYGSKQKDAAQQRHRKAEIEQRRYRVEEMMTKRLSIRDIASDLGVGHSVVGEDVKAIREGWRERHTGMIDDYVIEELESLNSDEAWLREMIRVEQNDDRKLRMFDRVFRVMVRRSELLGLDAPKVQRVLAGDEEDGGVRPLFIAGGTEEEYLAALKRAQGIDPETDRPALKVVEG